MAKRREKNGSVPQFGGWDQSNRENLDYSMVFSQARANKKQQYVHNLANNQGTQQEFLGKHQLVSPCSKHSSTPAPQFGARDQKTEGNPKVSPRARANKKPHKLDITRRSLGNEQQLCKHQEVSPMKHCPMSVPSFGDWNQKSGGSPDYLNVSPQDRANKKQHNHDLARRSLGIEHEHGRHREVSPRKTGWLSVPQFGEWDQKSGSETNYSVVFSQARANRKKHKNDLTHRSYDFEQELLCQQRDQAATRKKKKFLTYFTCCLPG